MGSLVTYKALTWRNLSAVRTIFYLLFLSFFIWCNEFFAPLYDKICLFFPPSDCSVGWPIPLAKNDLVAEKLWEVSAKLVDLKEWTPLGEGGGGGKRDLMWKTAPEQQQFPNISQKSYFKTKF